MWTPLTDGPVPADWEHAEPRRFGVDALSREPDGGGTFAALPPPAAKPKSYAAWTKEFTSWAARSQSVELLRSSRPKLTSAPR